MSHSEYQGLRHQCMILGRQNSPTEPCMAMHKWASGAQAGSITQEEGKVKGEN